MKINGYNSQKSLFSSKSLFICVFTYNLRKFCVSLENVLNIFRKILRKFHRFSFPHNLVWFLFYYPSQPSDTENLLWMMQTGKCFSSTVCFHFLSSFGVLQKHGIATFYHHICECNLMLFFYQVIKDLRQDLNLIFHKVP